MGGGAGGRQNSDGQGVVLRSELAEQNERISDLEAELKEVRRSIGIAMPAAAPARPAVVPDEEVEPATVAEALDEAARRFAPRVTVLDTARRSAEASDFGRPVEVFQALWAIRDVGEICDDAFEERGVKYAAQESRVRRGDTAAGTCGRTSTAEFREQPQLNRLTRGRCARLTLPRLERHLVHLPAPRAGQRVLAALPA